VHLKSDPISLEEGDECISLCILF